MAPDRLEGFGKTVGLGLVVAGDDPDFAGDLDADGYADVIVGAYFSSAGGSQAGRAYVYLGGSSVDTAPDVVLTGAAAGDQFGYLAVVGR